MISKQPKKWRETVDPYSICFKNIKILEVLGYPHAANDVFYLKALYEKKEIYCFLKYARHIDANIKNEIQILNALKINNIPRVIEYADDFSYIITEELEGKRLSTILGDNINLESRSYMSEFGKTLAIIHKYEGIFDDAPHRRFHEIPEKDYFKDINLIYVYNWLVTNKPHKINRCFIHGDFHYANIIWKDQHISGILDFELSGIGNKEFDIAWAIILRPEQNFLHSKHECLEFIKGYRLINNCDSNLVNYYMTLIYSRFYMLGDKNYKEYILNWYKENLNYKYDK